MIRISRVLGLTCHMDPVKIEFDLMELVPKKNWILFSHLIIRHGRARCFARRPDCGHCEIENLCPSANRLKIRGAALPREANKAKSGQSWFPSVKRK